MARYKQCAMCGGFTLNADTDVCENAGCHGSKVGPSATVSGGIGNKASTADPDKGREEDQESPYKYFLRSLEGGGDPDRQTGTPAESPAKSIAHRDARRTPMSWLRKLFERPSGTMHAKVDASQMPVATAGTRLRRDEATPAVEQAPEQPTYTLPQALVYMEEIGKQMGFLRPAQTHYQIAVADLMRRQPLYIRDRSLSIPLVVVLYQGVISLFQGARYRGFVEICGAPESLSSFLAEEPIALARNFGLRAVNFHQLVVRSAVTEVRSVLTDPKALPFAHKPTSPLGEEKGDVRALYDLLPYPEPGPLISTMLRTWLVVTDTTIEFPK